MSPPGSGDTGPADSSLEFSVDSTDPVGMSGERTESLCSVSPELHPLTRVSSDSSGLLESSVVVSPLLEAPSLVPQRWRIPVQ